MEIGGFYVLNLTDGIFHIGDETGVFATLVVGAERAFLADTASGLADLAGAVRTLTKLPLIVANTHGHIHHVGGNYQFGRVYLSAEERTDAARSYLKEARRRMLAAYPALHLEPERRAAYLNYDLENTEELRPGTEFDLGGETVVTVPLGNHTAGSVGFLCRERRLLIAGDALSPWMCLFGPEAAPLEAHCALLRELAEDTRFDRFLNSHSAQLWSRDEIASFLTCAEQARTGLTIRYEDILFPERTGRQYIQGSARSAGRAAIIFDPQKRGEDGGKEAGET